MGERVHRQPAIGIASRATPRARELKNIEEATGTSYKADTKWKNKKKQVFKRN